MELAEFQEEIRALTSRRRAIRDLLLEQGPLDVLEIIAATGLSYGTAGSALSEMGRRGIVELAGKRNRRARWRAVPEDEAGDVEAKIKKFIGRRGLTNGRRRRLSSDKSNPVGLRVVEFMRLSEDPDVQAELATGKATRRERSALKKARAATAARNRARNSELHDAQEKGEDHVEFIKIRSALEKSVDHVRELEALLRDEVAYLLETGDSRFADFYLRQLPPIVADGVEKFERVHAQVSRLTDCEPLPPREDILEGEYAEIDDAELILELGAIESATTDVTQPRA